MTKRQKISKLTTEKNMLAVDLISYSTDNNPEKYAEIRQKIVDLREKIAVLEGKTPSEKVAESIEKVKIDKKPRKKAKK